MFWLRTNIITGGQLGFSNKLCMSVMAGWFDTTCVKIICVCCAYIIWQLFIKGREDGNPCAWPIRFPKRVLHT